MAKDHSSISVESTIIKNSKEAIDSFSKGLEIPEVHYEKLVIFILHPLSDSLGKLISRLQEEEDDGKLE